MRQRREGSPLVWANRSAVSRITFLSIKLQRILLLLSKVHNIVQPFNESGEHKEGKLKSV